LQLERAKRYGYRVPDVPTYEELCDTADDQLLNKTVSNVSHVLHTILPPPSTALQQLIATINRPSLTAVKFFKKNDYRSFRDIKMLLCKLFQQNG